MIRTMFAACIVALVLVATGCKDTPVTPTTGSIIGRVTDAASGVPIAGAMVGTSPATSTVVTDANGAYRIDRVRPGAYAVMASAVIYLPGTEAANVTAGNTSTANIRLRRAADSGDTGGGSEGSALVFGNEGGYAGVPSSRALNLGGGSITIEAWMKARAFGSWNWLLTKGSSNAALEYLLGVDRQRASFNVNNASETAGDGQWNHLLGSTTLETGRWYHVAGVYDASTGSMQIFLNGRLEAQRNEVGPPVVTASPLFIGAREYFGSGRGVELFDGIITDVRLWNVARSATEINADMHRRLRGDERGLVGYWKVNEGEGTRLNDATRHGFNATILGVPQWVDASLPVN